MKTMRLLFTLLFVTAFASYSFGQGIDGSAHDFEGVSWNSTGEICIACHTPHDGDTDIAESPLWNHTLTTQTFTEYTSTTMNAVTGEPDGISKLCLSCHDGITYLDAFGGAAGGTAMIGIGAKGTDLSNDHPISFTYDGALQTADGQLNDPTASPVLDLLFGGKMECASCHDVHNSTGLDNLLRLSNVGSGLCLTCHDK